MATCSLNGFPFPPEVDYMSITIDYDYKSSGQWRSSRGGSDDVILGLSHKNLNTISHTLFLHLLADEEVEETRALSSVKIAPLPPPPNMRWTGT